MGIDMLALGQLLGIEWFASGLLCPDHLKRCVGRIPAFVLALFQPAGDHRLRGMAVEYQEGSARLLGDFAGGLALIGLEIGGVDHDRETGQ